MSVELKIKSKHLALEPAIIKHEERKLLTAYKRTEDKKYFYKFNSLVSHRKYDIRKEARATYLARGYIAGKPYNVIENKCKNIDELKPLISRILAMVKRYHKYNITEKEISDWLNGVQG
jgi:hypothetical protein